MTAPDSLTNGGLRSAKISATAGNLYKANAYSYTQTSGQSWIYLEFWDSSNNRIGLVQQISSTLNFWEDLQAAGPAPIGTATLSVLVYRGRTYPGTSYFDDASVTLISGLLPIQNPSFESGPDGSTPVGWAAAGGTSLTSSGHAHTGSKSVRMEFSYSAPGNNVALRSNYIPITPGIAYQGTVWATPLYGLAIAYLEFWDVNKKKLSLLEGQGPTQQIWQQIDIRGQAPSNAAYASLLLYVPWTTPGKCNFDDAQLSIYAPPSPNTYPQLVAGHPRLYFTSSDVSALQARATDANPTLLGPSPAALWSKVKAAADGFLAETTFYQNPSLSLPLVQSQFPTNGTTPFWTAICLAIQQRIETLSLAYVMTGNTSYAAKVWTDYLYPVCQQFTSWTDPTIGVGSNLDSCYLVYGTAFAYDTLYSYLSSTQRSQVESALHTLGLAPLFADTLNPEDQNIVGTRAAALTIGALAVLGVDSSANAYISRAQDYLSLYVNNRETSSQNEGLLYVTWVTDRLFAAAAVLQRVSGVRSLLDHDFSRKMIIPWLSQFLAPGGGGNAAYGDSLYYGLGFVTSAIINSDASNPTQSQAGWYIANSDFGAQAPDFERFLYSRPGAVSTVPSNPTASSLIAPISWLSLRTGWTAADTLVTFVSSKNNQGHSHYDSNSFQIASNGTWLACDPGYQVLSPGPLHDFSVSYGHNTLHLEGAGQTQKGGGVLTLGVLSPSFDYARGEAHLAYFSVAINGNPLTDYTRHLAFVKPYYLVIYDSVTSTVARNVDWPLYGGSGAIYGIDGAIAGLGTSQSGQILSLQKGRATMSVRFVSPATPSIAVTTFAGAEGYGPLATVKDAGAQTSHEFLGVVSIAPYNRAGSIPAESLLPPAASSGLIPSLSYVYGVATTIYAAAAIGGYMELAFNVVTAGNYDVGVWLAQNPGYGVVQCSIDGTNVGSTFDGYFTRLGLNRVSVGQLTLAAGSHRFRITVTGKNSSSTGFGFGVESIQVVPHGTATDPVFITPPPASKVSAAGVAGVLVDRAAVSNATDLVLFRTGTGTVAVSGMTFDADQAFVSFNATGKILQYSGSKSKSLSYTGQQLISTATACAIAATINSSTNALNATIQVTGSQSLSIYAPSASAVSLDGVPLTSGSYSYSGTTKLLTLTVPAGAHTVTAS